MERGGSVCTCWDWFHDWWWAWFARNMLRHQ
jgi:hypothetical protein